MQSEYSLWTRDPEPDVLPLCAEFGIGFVPWSPLGAGFLTGKVALTWLLARKPFIVPIFGTRRLDRVRENLGAAQVSLSGDEMAAIEASLAEITVVGDRLPAGVLELSYR